MAIRSLTDAAFEGVPFSDQTEGKVVDALRSNGMLTLSLVAEQDGDILGHVAFSPVMINDEPGDWYGLGPISVRPDRQRKGLGQMLIRHGLRRLRVMGAAGCVVFGSPDYYGRLFAFEHDPGLYYPGAPEGYFMRLVFRGPAPKGVVSYDVAFNAA